MRVCDLKIEEVQVGLVIKSLVSDKQGMIVKIDHDDDRYAWIHWDGDLMAYGGFYGNDCKCEVLDRVVIE